MKALFVAIGVFTTAALIYYFATPPPLTTPSAHNQQFDIADTVKIFEKVPENRENPFFGEQPVTFEISVNTKEFWTIKRLPGRNRALSTHIENMALDELCLSSPQLKTLQSVLSKAESLTEKSRLSELRSYGHEIACSIAERAQFSWNDKNSSPPNGRSLLMLMFGETGYFCLTEKESAFLLKTLTEETHKMKCEHALRLANAYANLTNFPASL